MKNNFIPLHDMPCMGNPDVLEWQKNSLLSWSDFKAESNPAVFEDSHSVIKYRFTWTVNSDKINDQIVFLIEDIRLFVEFHSLLSWIRLSESSDVLLGYEQGNFDLAELIMRENLEELQNEFRSKTFLTRGKNEEQRKQFAKEDSGKMISSKVEKLQELYDQKRMEYQEKTNFGQNTDEQLKYNLLFEQLKS